jgi:hypothetical protein
MSASAVPSTLDSPSPAAPPAAGPDVVPASKTAPQVAADEINGAVVIADATQRDDTPRDVSELTARRVGPATLMSPAVQPPSPGDAAPLAPENAVIDVGAPAHAYVPHGGGAAPAFGAPPGSPAMMHHGVGAPPAGGAPQRRTTSTTFLVLVVGGVVAAVALLAAAVVVVLFITRRRAAEAAESRGGRAPSGELAPPSAEPQRMAGTKARLAVTSAGALDPEAVRAALTTTLPRIDACFAATELDPPNHESAAYDLDVAPTGEVKRAEPATSTGSSRSAKLDACVVERLRSARMPKSAKPSTVRLTFSAPIESH